MRQRNDQSKEWQEEECLVEARELSEYLSLSPMGTVQYIGTGTEKCWHREDWNGEWDATAKVLVDIIKAFGRPVVNPEPIYLKGSFKNSHFQNVPTTREVLAK